MYEILYPKLNDNIIFSLNIIQKKNRSQTIGKIYKFKANIIKIDNNRNSINDKNYFIKIDPKSFKYIQKSIFNGLNVEKEPIIECINYNLQNGKLKLPKSSIFHIRNNLYFGKLICPELESENMVNFEIVLTFRIKSQKQRNNSKNKKFSKKTSKKRHYSRLKLIK